MKDLIKQFLLSKGGWIFGAVIVAFACRLSLWSIGLQDLAIAIAIVAAWPLIEYAAHRWFMHEWIWTPFRATHDRHHDNPCTETGLPDWWVVVMYYVNSLLFSFLPPGWYTAHCVALSMLCAYEFVHFSCHVDYVPATWWGYVIRINHLQHHGLNSRDRYAMLFPLIKAKNKGRS